MNTKNIIAQIVEQRKKDIAERGFNFGYEIPEVRTRPVNPFMEERGVILEVKRASPSKGDIAPDLNPAETALKYRANGAGAISCLTEENYFKGNLGDLMAVCAAVPDVAVLRKDFLIDEREIEIAYLCGADAVLLISGILSLEKMKSMTAKCAELGIRAFVEVRTDEDAQKVLEVKKYYPQTIVCGVNSRNLKDFSIDLLVPAMLLQRLGGNVIFESGITTPQAAANVGSIGFCGLLLGEFAARAPEKAGEFVRAFKGAEKNLYGQTILSLAQKVYKKKESSRPLVKICGLTRADDVLMADSLGADFVGFIFAYGFARNVCGEKFEQIKKILPEVKAFKVAVITDVKSKEAAAATELVKEGILDFIQLHGIKYEELTEELKNIPHYFALTSKEKIEKSETEKLDSLGEARYLQDCKAHVYGSTEHLWLAGGLTAENVGELCKKFNPELVDVSGGIEGNVCGEKDAKKTEDFFNKVTNIA